MSQIQVILAATPLYTCIAKDLSVNTIYLATPIQVSTVVVTDQEI